MGRLSCGLMNSVCGHFEVSREVEGKEKEREGGDEGEDIILSALDKRNKKYQKTYLNRYFLCFFFQCTGY